MKLTPKQQAAADFYKGKDDSLVDVIRMYHYSQGIKLLNKNQDGITAAMCSMAAPFRCHLDEDQYKALAKGEYGAVYKHFRQITVGNALREANMETLRYISNLICAPRARLRNVLKTKVIDHIVNHCPSITNNQLYYLQTFYRRDKVEYATGGLDTTFKVNAGDYFGNMLTLVAA